MLRLVDIQKSFRLGTLTVDVLRGVRLEVATGDLMSIHEAVGERQVDAHEHHRAVGQADGGLVPP